MKSINYVIADPFSFLENKRTIFLELLIQQNKVKNPNMEKIMRCSLLGICTVDDVIVSIGAIKPKTNSDFGTEKADLELMRNEFNIELGYCYTVFAHCGNGYSSSLVKHLINSSTENLMASTEMKNNNPMVGILLKNGFKQFGKPWKSNIHGGALGLFLKFLK